MKVDLSPQEVSCCIAGINLSIQYIEKYLKYNPEDDTTDKDHIAFLKRLGARLLNIQELNRVGPNEKY